MKVVVVDIDGVVATGTKEEVYSDEAGWNYAKCKPIEEGIRFVRELYDAGIYVKFHTSRWEQDLDLTRDWLLKHEVPYHELIMGKPSGDLYIDDRNYPISFQPQAGYTAKDVIGVIEARDKYLPISGSHK